MKKTVTALFLLFIIVPATGFAEIRQIQQKFEFGLPEILDFPEKDTLSVPGTGEYYLTRDWPAMPFRLMTQTLPFGTVVKDFSVSCSPVQTLELDSPLRFTKGPRLLSDPDQKLEFESFDTSRPYPGDRVQCSIHGGLNPETLLPISILVTRIFPVQYVNGAELLYTGQMDVTVTLDCPDIPVTIRGTDDVIPYVMVIPEAFQTVAAPYITHRTNSGLTPAVYTIESILASYSGIDPPEQLKNFIRDMVETHGTTFVMLGGDADQIPVRIRTRADAPLSETLPIEGYYADLYDSSGNYMDWDANDDGEYGTYTDDLPAMDFLPDLFLARIPASTPEEFQIALTHVINYETNTSETDEWFNTALLTAVDIFNEEEHGETSGIPEGERFAEFLITDPFNTVTPIRLYETDTYPHEGRALPSEVVAHSSQGCGFMAFDCHGAPDCLWLINECFTNQHAFAMQNGEKLPVIFALACSTAAFDNEIPGWPYSSGRESMPEHFLLNPDGGGIGYVGATRVAMASSFGHNQYRNMAGSLEYPYFKAYFEGMSTTGQMLAYSQHHFIEHVGVKDYYDYFNLVEHAQFGDPTVTIGGLKSDPDLKINRCLWVEASGNGDACLEPGETFNLTLDLINNGITANNVTAQVSCADPDVSLPDSICTYGEIPRCCNTSPGAPLQVLVDPGSPVNRHVDLTVELFVDAIFHRAYTVTAYIGADPYLEYRDWDFMYNSSNNGNVDPGDQIYLSIFLQNTGWSDATDIFISSLTTPSNYVDSITITSDGAVGSLSAGHGMFTPWGVIQMFISNHCPHETEIEFTAVFETASSGPWTMTFSIPVIDMTGPKLTHFSISPQSAEVNTPVQIVTQATDVSGVVSVFADIETYPDGNRDTLELYDDGQHGDGDAGDGTYGLSFNTTGSASDYIVNLQSVDGLGNERIIEEALTFTTIPLTVNPILVINTAERSGAEQFISDALMDLGLSHTIWNDRFRGPLTSDVLETFAGSTLIWTFGMLNSPNPSQLEVLTNYLDNGGGLLMCGWDLARGINRISGGKDWLENYLGVQFKGNNTEAYEVEGVVGDPLTEGLSFRLKRRYDDLDLAADKLIASETGITSMIFTDLPEYAGAVRHQDTGIRTVLLPFSLELMRFEDEIDELLSTFLPWLADRPFDPSLILNLNQSFFVPGDPFILSADMMNPHPDPLDTNLLVALNIDSLFWFWPSWVQYPPDIDSERLQIEAFSSQSESILEFTWPEISGTGSGITFYGIMMNEDSSSAISDLVYTSFGYGS
jgi:Peptidase family C25